jgi:UDP-N-acetylglucosamine 2-epimerase (non-hydrolysing)
MTKPVVVSIFGTRPEAIKMAPLALLLNADPDIDHHLVVTAQHRGLLDDVLALFSLTADVDLDIMRQSQGLHYITRAALAGLEDALAQLRPDFVLVHGDTTTTFAAALSAFYAGIPVGHVEAGLRTESIAAPFPEEFNRRATDLLSAHCYCPTPAAAARLAANPDCTGELFITGNTALDAVARTYRSDYSFRDPQLAGFAAYDGPRLLLTAHRRENWGEPLNGICGGLLDILAAEPAARAVVCLHPNPEVAGRVTDLLGGSDRVVLIPAPPFDEFVNLLGRCTLALTDSGGIQEEITVLNRFALVLRDQTERPEAVEGGYARVVGTDRQAIASAAAEVLPRCLSGQLPGGQSSPFGDGRASQRILEAVRWRLGLAQERPADYRAGGSAPPR